MEINAGIFAGVFIIANHERCRLRLRSEPDNQITE